MRVPAGGEPMFEVQVPSSSGKDGEVWLVRLLPGGSWTCTCPGFTYREKCRHIDLIRSGLHTEDVTSSQDLL